LPYKLIVLDVGSQRFSLHLIEIKVILTGCINPEKNTNTLNNEKSKWAQSKRYDREGSLSSQIHDDEVTKLYDLNKNIEYTKVCTQSGSPVKPSSSSSVEAD